jgi:hypothetical protein
MEVANGGSSAQSQNGSSESNSGYKLKFCTVCASNNNRFVDACLISDSFVLMFILKLHGSTFTAIPG